MFIKSFKIYNTIIAIRLVQYPIEDGTFLTLFIVATQDFKVDTLLPNNFTIITLSYYSRIIIYFKFKAISVQVCI